MIRIGSEYSMHAYTRHHATMNSQKKGNIEKCSSIFHLILIYYLTIRFDRIRLFCSFPCNVYGTIYKLFLIYGKGY